MATALCPGSFDPVTLGHLDIIERTARHFDEVIVAVIRNPQKTQSLFSLEERQEMLKEATAHLANIQIEFFKGLLVEFAQDHGADAIVKGLRAVSDFDYELQMAQMNQRLSGIDTFFISTSPQHSFLSSSLVREVARFGGDVSSMVPKHVADRLVEMFPTSRARTVSDARGRAREGPRHRCAAASAARACSTRARKMPLSASVMLNRDEFGEILQDAIDGLPEELRQARWLLKERDEVLERAEHEAERIIDVGPGARRAHGGDAPRSSARRAAPPRTSSTRPSARPRQMRLEAEDYVDRKLAGVRGRARPHDAAGAEGPGAPLGPRARRRRPARPRVRGSRASLLRPGRLVSASSARRMRCRRGATVVCNSSVSPRTVDSTGSPVSSYDLPAVVIGQVDHRGTSSAPRSHVRSWARASRTASARSASHHASRSATVGKSTPTTVGSVKRSPGPTLASRHHEPSVATCAAAIVPLY